MHPILIHTPFFDLHTYGAMTALAFLLGYIFTARWGRAQGMPSPLLSDALTWILIGGIGGARLLYVAVHPLEFSGAPWETFKIWQGGLMWHGGLIGGALAGAMFFRSKKVSLALAADVFAPGLALGQAIGRLGCFFAGCCYGKSCDRPWAVTFTDPGSLAPQGVPLHPTQLYDAVFNGAIFLVLWWAGRKESLRPGRGRLFALYLLFAALARGMVEFFRDDDRGRLGVLTATQTVSLGLLLLGLWGLARRKTP